MAHAHSCADFCALSAHAKGRWPPRVALLVFVLLGSASSTPVRAQTAADSAERLAVQGADAFGAGTREGYERAIRLWQQTLPLYRRLGLPANEAPILNGIGAIFNRLGGFDSALVYFSRALPIYRALGNRGFEATTLNNIGFSYGSLGRFDSALTYFARALPTQRELGDRLGEARTLNNMGQMHHGLGRPDSAHAYYTAALPVWRLAGDRAGEAITLQNLGTLHTSLGRTDSSFAYFGQALAIQRLAGDREGAGSTLKGIGFAYSRVGRLDSAFAYFAQALSIFREVGDRAGEAQALNNISQVYGDLGQRDSALAYLASALLAFRAIAARHDEATTLNNIGMVHRDLGRLDSALAYLEQALEIHRAVRDRRGEARTLNNIGLVHHDLSRPDSALVYYSSALPIWRNVGERAGEAMTLANIAHHHHLTGGVRVAVAYYDSSAAVYASIAQHAGADANRLVFAEQQVEHVAVWALAWLALAPERGAANSAYAALAAAERGRAQALLDLMRRSAANARGTVGAGAASANAAADLAEAGRRLVSAVGRTRSAALVYLVTRDTLLIWLIGPSGDVSVLRSNVTAAQLADHVAAVRSGLGADSAAVRSRLALRDLPDLDPTSRGIGAGTAGVGSARTAAARLSAWLLPAELRQIIPATGELVIVPHGPLNLLPFSMLPTDSAGEPLGIRYGVRFAPSLATLAEIGGGGERSGMEARVGAVVVGNPTMPRVRNAAGTEVTLGPLAGAEAEARWVAGRVGTPALRGGAATEAEIKRRLPSASLVHLATHGYAYSSDARARDSFIALAPTPGEDGLLTVGEVLDAIPSLKADLVVLSACQTGLGDVKQAEGTVGLQRAFLAKGARSVLVSLWSVSDEATEQLMRSFYTHWLNGASKAEALRRAQTDVRGAPGSRFHDPRYWAAFQLAGASR